MIIMDLMLANGQSGYNIIEKIRQEPQFANIPAVVVSASDPTIEMNKARDSGFQGYIPKPINNYSFAKIIAAIIGGQQVWGDDFSEHEYQSYEG